MQQSLDGPTSIPGSEELGELLDDCVAQIVPELARIAPAMAKRTESWLEQLVGEKGGVAYFQHIAAAPLFLMPWWLEEKLRGAPDRVFQGRLVKSSVCGYLFIRVIDDLMDGDGAQDLLMLPALAVFHTGFQSPYMHYFDAVHPFWSHFRAGWWESHDATLQDGIAQQHPEFSIDREHFERVTARKSRAVEIPVAAVCHHYGRMDLFADWPRFIDAFLRWHHMFNDTLDWYRDLKRGGNTYLLSEARRSGIGEVDWFVSEGVEWSRGRLREWMETSRKIGERLDCAALMRYLEIRHTHCEQQFTTLEPTLRALAAFA